MVLFKVRCWYHLVPLGRYPESAETHHHFSRENHGKPEAGLEKHETPRPRGWPWSRANFPCGPHWSHPGSGSLPVGPPPSPDKAIGRLAQWAKLCVCSVERVSYNDSFMMCLDDPWRSLMKESYPIMLNYIVDCHRWELSLTIFVRGDGFLDSMKWTSHWGTLHWWKPQISA